MSERTKNRSCSRVAGAGAIALAWWPRTLKLGSRPMLPGSAPNRRSNGSLIRSLQRLIAPARDVRPVGRVEHGDGQTHARQQNHSLERRATLPLADCSPRVMGAWARGVL